MKHYARVASGIVVEVIELADDLVPGVDLYTPEFAADLVACSAEVQQGWLPDEAGFAPPPSPIFDLAAAKTAAKRRVDAAAETERLKYITAGAGQAMTYQAKVEEARRLAEDPSPDPEDYPLLSAEVGITAPTLAEVGATVVAAYQQWLQIGALIEAARLGAKQAVGAAETVEALQSISPDWP